MSDNRNAPRRIGGLIVAAGESRRMGKPKALLPMPTAESDETSPPSFIEHLIDAFCLGGCHPIVVVVGHHADIIRESTKRLVGEHPGLEIVTNLDHRRGMLSSIRVGIRRLAELDCDAAMLCPVDYPNVGSPLVSALIRAFETRCAPVTVPLHRGRRGHPVLFSRASFDELLQASDELGARQVVWNHADDLHELSVDNAGILEDVDTPELYEALRNRTAAQARSTASAKGASHRKEES